MPKTFIIVVLALCVVVAHAGYPSLIKFRDYEEIEFNCTMAGFQCKSCEESVFCEEDPNGNLVAYLADKCKLEQGLSCSDATGICTADYNEKCDPSVAAYEFKCQQAGVFPEPFDCTKYRICPKTGDVPDPITCPAGFAFEPSTQACTFPTTATKKCTNPIKPCKGAGQFPLPGHPRMYYVCRFDVATTFFFPYLYNCPGNMKFIGKCVNPTSFNENIDSNGKCTANGNFYVPNCKQYNECTVGKTPYLKTCSTCSYFDHTRRVCTSFGCGNVP